MDGYARRIIAAKLCLIVFYIYMRYYICTQVGDEHPCITAVSPLVSGGGPLSD